MKQNEKIIAVLSAGRSGTSLLMNLLNGFGMDISEKTLPAGPGNPDGYFEDVEILEIQKKLFESLSCEPSMYLPEGWEERKETQEAVYRLREIVEIRLEHSKNIWGFKDPRTSISIPLWNRIFNPFKVKPVYILAVRNPSSVVSSLRRQIKQDESISEMIWLQRNCEAIFNTSADCYILHYEDWFNRAEETALSLLSYTGIRNDIEAEEISEVTNKLIKEKFDRSSFDGYEIKNRYVNSLYGTLSKCRGDQFDRAALMNSVQKSRKAISEFKGWNNVAQRKMERQRKIIISLEQDKQKKIISLEKDQNDKIILLEQELKNAVDQSNNYMKEVKDYREEIKNMRIREASRKDNNKYGKATHSKIGLENDYNKLKKKYDLATKNHFEVLSSNSFRLGNIIIKAIKKPGLNTIIIPFQILSLFFELFFTSEKSSKKK